MDGLNLEHSHVTVLLHGSYYKSVPSTCNHFNFYARIIIIILKLLRAKNGFQLDTTESTKEKDLWHVTCIQWHVTCIQWHVTCIKCYNMGRNNCTHNYYYSKIAQCGLQLDTTT